MMYWETKKRETTLRISSPAKDMSQSGIRQNRPVFGGYKPQRGDGFRCRDSCDCDIDIRSSSGWGSEGVL